MTGTYIEILFTRSSPTGKTDIFHVRNRENTVLLGAISWFGPWRKYCFYPTPGPEEMVFEWTCLREIADFCESKTKEHRSR